jgi:hypothetical protein
MRHLKLPFVYLLNGVVIRNFLSVLPRYKHSRAEHRTVWGTKSVFRRAEITLGLCKDGVGVVRMQERDSVIQSQMSQMSPEECVEKSRTTFRATYVGGMKLSRLYNASILRDRGPKEVVAPEDACATSPWVSSPHKINQQDQASFGASPETSRRKSVWSGPQALVDWATLVFPAISCWALFLSTRHPQIPCSVLPASLCLDHSLCTTHRQPPAVDRSDASDGSARYPTTSRPASHHI